MSHPNWRKHVVASQRDAIIELSKAQREYMRAIHVVDENVIYLLKRMADTLHEAIVGNDGPSQLDRNSAEGKDAMELIKTIDFIIEDIENNIIGRKSPIVRAARNFDRALDDIESLRIPGK